MISIKDRVLKCLSRNWRNLESKVWIIFLFIFIFSGNSLAGSKPIAKGDLFPDLSFKNTLSGEEQAYLGTANKKFSFKNIKGTLFVVELFSTYCMSCPKNIPVLNSVYSSIENDPTLREKAKVIGIAVGNTLHEVKSYKLEHRVRYPVLADYNFSAHKALGSPRVPYTMAVKKETSGKGRVVYIHQGVIESADEIIKKIREILSEQSRKSMGHMP